MQVFPCSSLSPSSFSRRGLAAPSEIGYEDSGYWFGRRASRDPKKPFKNPGRRISGISFQLTELSTYSHPGRDDTREIWRRNPSMFSRNDAVNVRELKRFISYNGRGVISIRSMRSRAIRPHPAKDSVTDIRPRTASENRNESPKFVEAILISTQHTIGRMRTWPAYTEMSASDDRTAFQLLFLHKPAYICCL